METDIIFDCSKVDWNLVSETLRSVGMARFKKAEAMTDKGFTE